MNNQNRKPRQEFYDCAVTGHQTTRDAYEDKSDPTKSTPQNRVKIKTVTKRDCKTRIVKEEEDPLETQEKKPEGSDPEENKVDCDQKLIEDETAREKEMQQIKEAFVRYLQDRKQST